MKLWQYVKSNDTEGYLDMLIFKARSKFEAIVKVSEHVNNIDIEKITRFEFNEEKVYRIESCDIDSEIILESKPIRKIKCD